MRYLVPSYGRKTIKNEILHQTSLREKIRIRTDEELKLQALGLKEIRDIFDTLRIPYYISGGTLLGAIRERNFIRWDWDVGIDVKIEDLFPLQNQFTSALKENGFEIVSCHPKKTNFKINAVKYKVRYEILGYFKMGSMRYRKSSYYPNSFVEKQSEVELHGERYTTFQTPESYLEWFYGDWKTPRHTAKISDYVTASSRTKQLPQILAKIVSIFT